MTLRLWLWARGCQAGQQQASAGWLEADRERSAAVPSCSGCRCSPPHRRSLRWCTRPGWQTVACGRRGGPSARHHTSTTVTTAASAPTGQQVAPQHECFVAHSHPLFLSPAEDVHPVLDRVPAALPVQDVTQLDLVQVLPQHLQPETAKHERLRQHGEWQS